MVTPNASKLDVPRLVTDIPKYKPWLSPAAWREWEAFLDKIEELSVTPRSSWNMHPLIAAAITSCATRGQANASLSEDLVQLLEKENSVPAKV